MSNLSDFFRGIDGSLLKPKFQEFTASGNFTPTQGLVDAGGYIEVFLVGGGAKNNSGAKGASGGEVLMKKMYVLNTNPITVNIGGESPNTTADGTGSLFSGSQAGGVDLFASGGLSSGFTEYFSSPSWGAIEGTGMSAGNGVFGYGAGGASDNLSSGGVHKAKPNTGQGAVTGLGASGFCSVTWFE